MSYLVYYFILILGVGFAIMNLFTLISKPQEFFLEIKNISLLSVIKLLLVILIVVASFLKVVDVI